MVISSMANTLALNSKDINSNSTTSVGDGSFEMALKNRKMI